MTAAVGLPTLRLVRAQIGKLRINDLALGQTLVLSGNNATEIYNKYLKG